MLWGEMDKRVILLVEDNPVDAELTLLALKRSRILNPVVWVRDGAEALDYLFARGAYASRNALDLPALILLDLKLPKVNGLAVLTHVRSDEATHLVPVVVLTSSQEDQDMVHGYLLGCNGFVRKPVSFDEFSAAVVQLGMFWFIVHEAPTVPSRVWQNGESAPSVAPA